MNVRKTKRGWVIEITNTVHGCLEQDGVCGRKLLITREGLAKCGIDYDADADPESKVGDYGAPLWEIVLEFARNECSRPYVRVLRWGHKVQ